LVTDIVMPDGVSGWELAKTLKAEKPDLKAVYMSGHSTDANGHSHGVVKDIQFLAKPFGPETLAKAVRCCLDETRQFLNSAAQMVPAMQR